MFKDGRYECLQGNPSTTNIPVLIVDVSPEESVRKAWGIKESIQRDAEEYISRPVQPTHLAETVRRILGKGAPKPMESRDALEQMERSLKQVDQIKKILNI